MFDPGFPGPRPFDSCWTRGGYSQRGLNATLVISTSTICKQIMFNASCNLGTQFPIVTINEVPSGEHKNGEDTSTAMYKRAIAFSPKVKNIILTIRRNRRKSEL